MKLYAISDLHLGYEINREALKALPPHPDDWLIVAGDVGEKREWGEHGVGRVHRPRGELRRDRRAQSHPRLPFGRT